MQILREKVYTYTPVRYGEELLPRRSFCIFYGRLSSATYGRKQYTAKKVSDLLFFTVYCCLLAPHRPPWTPYPCPITPPTHFLTITAQQVYTPKSMKWFKLDQMCSISFKNRFCCMFKQATWLRCITLCCETTEPYDFATGLGRLHLCRPFM